MSEEKLTSNKLDIELKRQSLNSNDNRESYKPISEDTNYASGGDTVKNSNMVRENAEKAKDGADERMLGSDDKETLALKDVEVKFIAADPNGDAKIEIENAEKTFTGMTKEELMKYANDPFWQRLRWILFVLFWAAWVGMLVGAILIIINAPKCAAPIPLSWFKEGPLVKISDKFGEPEIEQLNDNEVRGVIYELPDTETYLVDSSEDIQERIKGLVEKYKTKNIHVVIDLTPNYVTKDDELLKKALANDAESLAAFVTSDKESKWYQVKADKNAWELNESKYFLKQFGDNFDLRLDNEVAKEKLKSVLSKLADIGVKGFRLANAKHFIIKASDFNDDGTNPSSGATLNQYDFYEHSQSTYRDGLGTLLREFSEYVKNVTDGEGFLTVKDDLSNHVEKYSIGGILGFEMPRFGFINSLFHDPNESKAKSLKTSFDTITQHMSSLSSIWMQLEYSSNAYANFNETAFKLFISLMNGVQIASFDDLVYINNKTDVYKNVQKEHKTPVFQHGNFEYYLSENDTAFAYSRMKSGNPGYFVAINPSSQPIVASFNETSILGPELTYFMTSYSNSERNANLGKIKLPAQSTTIFTFVPK